MSADFLSINSTFIVELGVFVVVLVVLSRFVIKPLNAAMSRRQAEIDRALAEAARVEELLAAAEADYRATMEQARRDARRIIDTAQRMATDSTRFAAARQAAGTGR